jgi:hypothetical protein
MMTEEGSGFKEVGVEDTLRNMFLIQSEFLHEVLKDEPTPKSATSKVPQPKGKPRLEVKLEEYQKEFPKIQPLTKMLDSV